MYRVVKRDGKVVDFDLNKICDAITKAFDACKKEYNPDVINLLALRVTSDFSSKVKEEKVSVEDIHGLPDIHSHCRQCKFQRLPGKSSYHMVPPK